MDTKHHLRIIGFKVIPYKNKKTGAAEEMRLAQCVVTSENHQKGQQVLVGELMMPKALADTPAGEYLAEFELAVAKTCVSDRGFQSSILSAKVRQVHACNDPLKTCSGDNPERESHEHDDGRRVQTVDGQARSGAGYRNYSG